MLLKVAFLLLVVWVLGIAGIFDAGSLVPVLLLAGLMLFLLGTLEARDGAAKRESNS